MPLFMETPRKKDKIKRDIIMKRGFTFTVMTNKPDNKFLMSGECPNCHIKVAWYSDGIQKYHNCSECNERVYL